MGNTAAIGSWLVRRVRKWYVLPGCSVPGCACWHFDINLDCAPGGPCNRQPAASAASNVQFHSTLQLELEQLSEPNNSDSNCC